MQKWQKIFWLTMIGVILSSSTSFAFQVQPWMNQWLEFNFEPSFLYRHYPYVSGGYNPKGYSSHDRFTTLEASVAVFETMDVELLIEFADTRKQSLGMQSTGAQIRYQWLDAIKGDFLSTLTHLNLRYVSSRALRDVSCPYHGLWNIEFGQSVGKEWEFSQVLLRPFVFVGLGQANFGYPWLKAVLCLSAVVDTCHRLDLFLDGYFGFGLVNKVNVDDFYGWGKIRHQSMELGLRYKYEWSKIWGSFSLFYGYRFYAKNYPAKASTWVFSYDLPFSML